MRMGNYYAYDYFTDTYNFVTGCTWTTMQDSEPGTFEITNPIDDQNLWHHYLCSFDATNGLLAYYVDGVLISQYDGVYIQTVTAPVVVGYTPAGFPNFDEGYYTGWLDDLMIYDSAVSETGVAYIYNSTNPPAPREIPAPPPCDIPEGCPQPAATLTLTATPIPRTLQFSLMGARDLSIIATPPPMGAQRIVGRRDGRGGEAVAAGGEGGEVHPPLAQGDPREVAPPLRLALGHGATRERGGIDGDDLEVAVGVGLGADERQPVVRAHRGVHAAGAGGEAQRGLAPGHALLQAGGGHDEMVESVAHAPIVEGSATVPSMQKATSPPIQQSLPSCCTCTRPARPSAAPCAAT
jgi:hypothetical protein